VTDTRPSPGQVPGGAERLPVDTSTGHVEVDRKAAFAAGPSKMPRNIAVIFVVALAAIGLGGVALDHFFPGPVGTSTATTVAGIFPPPFQTPASAGQAAATDPQLPASSSALMGLQHLSALVAPGFSLADQEGRLVSPASFRGKVVVLTFFDAACDDICPVLETELSEAYLELGADASRVALLTVNTDPLALTAASAEPAEAAAHGFSLKAWYFLTGSLPKLNAVWSDYGVAIDVQRDTHIVSHNDILYFIDPSGRLRARATPFANESASGVFGLPRATEAAWAAGIAAQARSLLVART
jgi:cytochrome oxidase Cu insertion factor (SCO1/SenC/PrrC family)